MRTFSLALLAVALATPALAQEVTLRPGHPDLATSGLSLDDQVLRIRVTTPTARELGTVRYAYSRDGDLVTLVTTMDAPQAGGSSEVTTTFRWPSLAPVSQSSGASLTAYDGAHVTGDWAQGDWDPLPFDITLQSPAFAPEEVALIARALPLREGYSATVPVFNASQRLKQVTLTVAGQEDFTRADGSTVSTWVVEETGARTRRHFIDGTTRALIGSTWASRGSTQIVSEPVTDEALAALNGEAETPAIALRPGLDRLATGAFTSYDQSFVVRLVEPQQQDIGTMHRTAVVDRAAGTVTVDTETNIPLAGQMTKEHFVSAYPSLAPISMHSEANGTVVDLTYTATSLSGTKTANGETETLEATFDEPVYGTAMATEAVRLVPFEEGFRGEYFTISPSEGPLSIFFTVTGQDEIDGHAVWLVSVEAGPAAPPQQFAIDAETRAVRRIRLEPQLGVVIDITPEAAE